MSVSRRKFMESAITASTIGVLGRQALMPLAAGATVEGYRSNLLPSQKEVWDWQVWMAKLGPKYTGNKAHTTYVEFLASHLQELGLDVAREHYTLPRWEARRWEITITPASGKSFKAPVTSYFPYSGQFPRQVRQVNWYTPDTRRHSIWTVFKGRLPWWISRRMCGSGPMCTSPGASIRRTRSFRPYINPRAVE